MIYFIQPVEGGPVKIGTTENLDSRLKTLESHYGRSLAVLATADGGRDEERTIHERFAHLRLGRTEQFRPAPDLMEFIGRPLFAGDSDVEMIDISSRVRRLLFTVKGRRDWYDWLRGLAKHDRSSVAKTLDRAAARYALEIGFTEDPPER